jgi:fructose-1-phosphate kinase PfkB-like protein
MGAIAFCLERGLPLLEACRIGIAAAAAAMLTPATGLARKRDVARLSRGVAVWRFKSRARISASA